MSRQAGGKDKAGPERINASLLQLVRPIKQLRHDPHNARLHPDRNLLAIRHSLRRFGQQKPVVALADGTVVAGNGLLAAAQLEGWRRLAVVRLPKGMTPAEVRAYALADNRTAELAEWDKEALATTMRELQQVDASLLDFGWDQRELDQLLQGLDEEGGAGNEAGDDGGPGDMMSVRMTPEQWEVVERAIGLVRTSEGDPDMSDGRALELIAADYASGR